MNFAQGLSSGALQFVGDSHRNFRNTSFGFFGQDSFKLRRNLTLNYGLRYELNTVLNEAHGRLSSFRPQNFTTFLDPNDPTAGSLGTPVELNLLQGQNPIPSPMFWLSQRLAKNREVGRHDRSLGFVAHEEWVRVEARFPNLC